MGRPVDHPRGERRAGVWALLSCASFVVAAAGCTVQTPTPNLAGQDVVITVMHTSDMHSRFFPYFFAPGQIDKGLGLVPKAGSNLAIVGGIARISTVIRCVRGLISGPLCDQVAELTGPPAARSAHVDSGDIFQGAPVFNLFSGEVEVKSMARLGASAMVLANHEFDKGSANIVHQFNTHGTFPLLAANYAFGDPADPTQPKLAKAAQPWTIMNVGGVKVGIIGMANLSSIQGIIEGGNSLGVRPIETRQAMADAVRVLRPQVDILTVVSHLGLEEDEGISAEEAEEADENTKLAQEGIDVIFGGHLHIVLNPPKDLPHFDELSGAPKGHTVICHSGAFAKYVGRLDLVVHMPTQAEAALGERPRIKSHTYRLIPIDDRIPADPVFEEMLEPYQFKMNQTLNLSQVYALVPCPRDAGVCPKTARTDPGGGDSQLGNLVATSMRFRRRVEADFALTNSLGIRSDFESGPLTLEQLYNVFPFENTITTMFLSGDEIQQMLDFVAARSSERGCRSQVQVSGIFFDLACGTQDPECNARLGPGVPCAKNIYLGDKCRLPDGSIDTNKCKPLEPYGEYRVAVNDYIANGGSGFAVLKRNTTKFNTGISLRDSLADYLRTLPDRCDPGRYVNVTGVTCRHATGESFDCTAQCCCHDEESGPNRCSARCEAFQACSAMAESRVVGGKTISTPISPQLFDLSNTACLSEAVEAHDGRINPLMGTGP